MGFGATLEGLGVRGKEYQAVEKVLPMPRKRVRARGGAPALLWVDSLRFFDAIVAPYLLPSVTRLTAGARASQSVAFFRNADAVVDAPAVPHSDGTMRHRWPNRTANRVSMVQKRPMRGKKASSGTVRSGLRSS